MTKERTEKQITKERIEKARFELEMALREYDRWSMGRSACGGIDRLEVLAGNLAGRCHMAINALDGLEVGRG